MLELALKIVPWLALSALLGFVMAWLLRGLQLGELKAQMGSLETEQSVREHELGASRRTLDAALERVASLELEVTAIVQAEATARSTHAIRGLNSQGPTSAALIAPAPRPQYGARATSTASVATDERLIHAEVAEPGGTGDDLTCIRGVGPVLAKMLHRLGIHSYKQVAQWSEVDINFIDAQLQRFRGRIRRENWVRSAMEEHHKKYGEWLGSSSAAVMMREDLHD